MKLFSTRFLFIVWLVDSVAWACLIVYFFMHGSDPDTIKLSEDLGAVWGGTVVFLIGPGWREMKQWPASRRKVVLSALFIFVAVVGGWFWFRVRQTAKLEALFKEDQELERTVAPKKQRFMQLLSQKQNAKTLPEYLQTCADLEPATSDYEDAERQVDNLLSQMQQEIGELKPQASYGSLLPGIPAKDRTQFYNANIQPVVEQERKIAQEEVEILKDAKSRGVTLPKSVYEGAGIK